MKKFIALFNPMNTVTVIYRNHDLIKQFIRQEIVCRYRGSIFGWAWSLLTPVIMLVVYTCVFGIVFKARWGKANGAGSMAEFAMFLFAGQLTFQIFGESAQRAPGLIIGVTNFVKRVVFPLEIIPIAIIGTILFNVMIGFAICASISAYIYGGLSWTVCLVPLAVIPMILLALGVSWFLSSIGVYIRDISHLVGIALQVIFFATPIVYPISAIPERFRFIVEYNPLTVIVDLLRGCLIAGDPGTITQWTLAYGIGICFATLGLSWFQVTKKGFSDVL
jgi:lipopolysaccharide transport system permease protein